MGCEIKGDTSMRKFVYSMMAVGLGTAAIASSVAVADSSNAALHIRGTECEVFDGNGNNQFVPYHELRNNNHVEVVCRGRVPNDTGTTVQYDTNSTGLQYECGSGTVSTSWHETVSASGESTTKITCLPNR